MYAYDALGRVVGVTYSSGDTTSYSYDAAGNRTQLTATSSIPPPAVTAKVLTTAYNTAGSVDLAPSGVYDSVAVATEPTKGAVLIAGTIATYTPTAGVYGSDSFTFTASGRGGKSAPATVSVTVTAPPPVVSTKTIAVVYNTSGTVDLAPSGVWTSISFASAPTKGTLSLRGSTVTYTPAAGTFGADSFTFTAAGPGGTSAPATVAITVSTPPAPTVSAMSQALDNAAGRQIHLAVTGVYTHVSIVTPPTHGTVAYVRGGTTGDVIYTSNSGYIGSDSFGYVAVGPGGTSSPATVNVTVHSLTAPTVLPTSVTTSRGQVWVDLFLQGEVTSVAPATAPSHGSVTLVNGQILYMTTGNYAGADSFSVVATGPGGTSSPGMVSVTATRPSPQLSLPLARAYSVSMPSDNQTRSIGSPGGDWAYVTLVAAPAHGVIVSGDPGGFQYTPASGYVGSDSVSYTATGPLGTSAPGIISITITQPVPVVANPTTLNASYNHSVSKVLEVSGTFTSMQIATAPAHGAATIADYQVTYTPNLNYTGQDSFTYTATGPLGVSAPATVSVTVGGP